MGDDGIRTKDGKQLKLRSVIPLRRSLNLVFDPSTKKTASSAGIKIDPKTCGQPQPHWKNRTPAGVHDRMASMSWGGLIFPNPETSWNGGIGFSPSKQQQHHGIQPTQKSINLIEGLRCANTIRPSRRTEIIRQDRRPCIFQEFTHMCWTGSAQTPRGSFMQTSSQMPEFGCLANQR